METRQYHDACDASAAVRLGTSTCFAAASDEDNVLRVYDRSAPGPPLTQVDVTAFLEPDDPDETEADLEGAAQLGDRIFWIGSHGRSRKGRVRRVRQRLFATRVDNHDGIPRLTPVGVPYADLLRDLADTPGLTQFELGAASLRRPEEAGGLNAEGLAASPDGALLVGFRNPVPEGRALIVRIENAAELIEGTDTAARLTLAGHLDLGGRGIRALEFVPSLHTYLIVAGAFDDTRSFAVYRWSGRAAEAPVELIVDGLNALNPEELMYVDERPGVLQIDLLSDDGGDGISACKAAPRSDRRFRATSRLIRL